MLCIILICTENDKTLAPVNLLLVKHALCGNISFVNVRTKLWWSSITLLLLVAFVLRVGGLENVPPGLTHDEASNGHDSAAILQGIHRIYFPVGYGHEPLYNYSVAATTLLLGQSIFTLRLTSVGWSLLTWVLTVALARRWWGRRAALFTAAALTVGFWPLMMARLGLRAPTLPPLLAASALAYDHAFTSTKRKTAWAAYLLSGLFLGAGFYTYMASRGMPVLYLAFLIALAITDRRKLRQVWAGTLVVVGTAVLVGLPVARDAGLLEDAELHGRDDFSLLPGQDIQNMMRGFRDHDVGLAVVVDVSEHQVMVVRIFDLALVGVDFL